MRLLSLLSSTVALSSVVYARIPAYERCASPDIASIPCVAGSACAAVNSTFSQCIPSRRGGSTAASAARRADVEKRDGEGGQVNLINGTPFKWVLDRTNSYQLNAWDFPAEVLPFSTASVYVEFKTGFLVDTGDSAGEAAYHLDGTDQSFEVQARGNDGLHIQTVFTGLSTPNNDQGSTLNLGWRHDGAVNFALSGVDGGSFISSNAPSDFLTRSLSTFGDVPLGKLVLPASHDAGMFKLDGNTAGAMECNTLTQTRTIFDQLNLGARYFDIRPVISGGIFKTGHYSKLSVEEIGLDAGVGGNGEKFEFLINDINNFQEGKKELIIINLSHDFQTDEGYRGLNEDEWKRMFEQLKGINNLYISATPDAKLIDLPLNAFISEHSAVIIVAEAGSEFLGDLRGQGFFTYDQLGPFNSYSDSDDLNTMVDDQFRKMHDQSGDYFLLSFTLTQKVPAVVLCPAMPSIVDLADRANAALYARVLNEANKDAYPKLLFIDNFASSDIIPLAMAINYKIRA